MTPTDSSLADIEARLRDAVERRADLVIEVRPPSVDEVRAQAVQPVAVSRRPHIRTIAIAVGAAAAMIASAMWLLPTEDDQADVVVSDPPVVDSAGYLPTWLPDGLDGPTEVETLEAGVPLEAGGYPEPYAVFGKNGVPLVRSALSSSPLPPDLPLDQDPDAEWIDHELPAYRWNTEDGQQRLALDLLPGVSVTLSTRLIDIDPSVAEMLELADSIDVGSGLVDPERLPVGWELFPDVAPISGLPDDGNPVGTSWESAGYSDASAAIQRAAFVDRIESDAADTALSQLQQLAGGELLMSPEGDEQILRYTHSETPLSPRHDHLLWVLDDTHLGYLFAIGLDADDAERIARSVERTDPATWSQLLETVGAPNSESAPLVGTADSEVIGEGTLGEYSWSAVGGPTSAPSQMLSDDPTITSDWMAEIRVADGEGRSTRLTAIATEGSISLGMGRNALVAHVRTSTPYDVTDHSISYRGQPLPTAVIRRGPDDPVLVFALLPARETGNIAEGDFTLDARNPDSSPFAIDDWMRETAEAGLDE